MEVYCVRRGSIGMYRTPSGGSITKPEFFYSHMNPLNATDLHHLRAAEGWLDLGNAEEARHELAEISASRLDHPDVLELSWLLFAREENWSACVKTAELLVQQAPERPGGWIHRSFALHELHRTEEAYQLLKPVRRIFSDHWVIPYNLACYLAQLGRIKDAAKALHDALQVDSEAVKKTALADPDLEPLRKCIDELRDGDS